MKIKAILFDLDDTLVVDEAVSRETFDATAQLAMKHHGVDAGQFAREAARQARARWAEGPSAGFCRAIGISAFECLWGNFTGDTADLRQLREWALVFREKAFDAALRDQMIESAEGGRQLAEFFALERRRLQRLMPNARETLVRLSAAYQLGMLTNGAPDLQREKIAASGLADFFRAIAVSGEHGIGKPRPEIFFRLAEQLGIPPSECVMVGNSLERDIAGARNAGIISFWIKVPGSEEHASVEPDFTISGLAELPRLLGQLEDAEAGTPA